MKTNKAMRVVDVRDTDRALKRGEIWGELQVFIFRTYVGINIYLL